MEIIDNLTRCFLVAMPSMRDSNFSRSVVYLFENSDRGTLGVIINKPLPVNLSSVFDQLGIHVQDDPIGKQPVLTGGPVNQESGFIIYSFEKPGSEDPQDIKNIENKIIRVSASRTMLENIAKNKGPNNFIVTLGYSSWLPGQLEQEIIRNDWLIVPSDPRIIFKTGLERRWSEAAKLIGIDLTKLTHITGHG